MATGTVPKRQEIATEHTWNLESIYTDDALWEEDFKRLEGMIPQLEGLSGTLGQNADALLHALQQRDEAY